MASCCSGGQGDGERQRGNSMIIIYESDYTSKVQNFISNNNFVQVPRDVSNRLQRDIKNTINECEVIFPKQNTHIERPHQNS